MKENRTQRAGIAGTAAALVAGAALTLGSLGITPVNSGMDVLAKTDSGVAQAEEATLQDAGGQSSDASSTTAGATASVTASSGVEIWPENASTPVGANGEITQVGIYGTFDAETAEAMLERVNEIRAEAHEQGITVDGQVVSGTPLTWSQAYEYMAQVRAAEISFDFTHARPSTGTHVLGGNSNFKDGDGVTGSKITSYSEDIAMVSTGLDAAQTLEEWYSEKGDLTAFSSSDPSTGHYVSLISDNYTTIGLGLFQTDDGWYLVAELGDNATASANVRSGSGIQMIAVSDSDTDWISATVTSSSAVSEDGQPLSLVLEPGQTDTLSASVVRNQLDDEQAASAAAGEEVTPTTTNLNELIDMSWTSSDTTVATIDSNGTVTATGEGSATLSLMSGTQTLATVNVTVEAAAPAVTAVSASTADVSTEAGIAPVLPSVVTVTMSDGTTVEDVPVTWEAIDPSLYSGAGSFEATGTATLSDGSTVSATCNVTVEAAVVTIASVAAPSVTTTSGTAPVLPDTVTATMSDGSTQQVSVAWDEVDPAAYSSQTGGTFTVHGTVDGFDDGVDATVIVSAATAVSASAQGVTTTAGTAPKLPDTASVTWSNGEVTDEDVVWNEIDPSKYANAGAFTATGTSAGVGVTCEVTVEAAAVTISSVDSPSVTTASGTAPELPDTVSATMSDGSTQQVNVAWDEVDPADYSAREGGSFTVHGTIEGFSDGVDASVTVSAATAVSAKVQGVATTAGTAPDLPETASVTWSNGDVTDEDVTWDNVDPSDYAQAGSFEASGTAAGVEVTCTVTVEAAETTISSVESPSVTTSSGTAPELPDTVTATMSDGSTQQVNVAWDEVDPASYSAREGGSFAVHGTVEGFSESVDAIVTVSAATAVSAEVQGVSTTAGTAPDLPETASVTWSNGDVTDEEVAWDKVDPSDYAQAGSFEATGTAAGVEVTSTVTVEAAAVSISSVASPSVTTTSGTAPELPSKVNATMSDGSTQQVNVKWDNVDPADYSAREGGSFVIHGSIEGYADGVDASVTVTAATAETATAEGVTTTAGTAPELPDTASVTWSNGDVTDEEVAWDKIDPSDYAQAGSFEATGTAAGVEVTCTVTVEALTIESVESPSVTTASGTAPELPDTVTATMSDGSSQQVDVAWDEIDSASYSAREGGSFVVHGSIEGYADGVDADVTVTAATAENATAEEVTTTAGTAPALPETVSVTWSNGDVTDEAVAWDDIDPSEYANAGEFKVIGTAAGVEVTCTVTVEALTIESVESPSVTTASGTAPELPDTVTATMSDGSAQQVDVAWDNVDSASYSAREGGTFTVHGTIEGYSDGVDATVAVTAATAETATAEEVSTTAGTAPALPDYASVTWSNGDVTDEEVTWDEIDPSAYASAGAFDAYGTVTGIGVTSKVTVEALTIESVESPSVTTASGTAPELPDTVSATMSDGSTQRVDVAWDEVDAASYSAREGGSFTVHGTIDGYADGVDASVTVTAATAVSASVDDVSTPAGVAPNLPAEASVSWSNGDVTQEPVTWEEIDPATYSASGTSFEVSGSVKISSSSDAAESASASTLSVTATVNVKDAVVSSVEAVTTTTVAGVAPQLPSTASVTWSNGDVTDEEVAWDDVDPSSYATAGTSFDVSGTVAGHATTCTVTVTAPTISAVESPSVTMVSGTAPELPDTVSATMSDGSAQQVDVTWDNVDPASYSAREGGSFAVHGTIDGYADGIDASVTVTAATAEIATAEEVTTTAGTAPDLPETASVTWSNGDVTDEAVTWDAIDPSAYASAGAFDAYGTVAGIGVTSKVTVEALTIESVESPSVTTASGTAPELPETVTATMSDGSTQQVDVAWDEVDPASYSAREGGTFAVHGSIDGYADGVDASVTVSAARAISTSAAEATTTAGTAPELPSTVSVTWSNGDVTDEAVTWDAIDPSKYANAGTFTATGTVTVGSASLRATCTVTVEALKVTRITNPDPVTTVAGVAPNLPQSVLATMSDGSTQQRKVTWDEINASAYHDAGSFTVNGTVEGTSLRASVSVTVTDPTVLSVQNPINVTTTAGTAPTLPETVSVTWSNKDVTQEKVTWDEISADKYATAGTTFQVNGTVAGRNIVANVSVQQAQISETGDHTSIAPFVIAGVIGICVVSASVLMLRRALRSSKSRR